MDELDGGVRRRSDRCAGRSCLRRGVHRTDAEATACDHLRSHYIIARVAVHPIEERLRGRIHERVANAHVQSPARQQGQGELR